MQFVIEIIRKVVVLVLLMEVVLQLQSGKQYEPYIKMLIGIMVVYSLVSGIFGVWNKVEAEVLAPMQEFQWTGSWFTDFEQEADKQVEEEMKNGETQGGVVSGQLDGDSVDIDVQVDIAPVAEIAIGNISEITRGSSRAKD